MPSSLTSSVTSESFCSQGALTTLLGITVLMHNTHALSIKMGSKLGVYAHKHCQQTAEKRGNCGAPGQHTSYVSRQQRNIGNCSAHTNSGPHQAFQHRNSGPNRSDT
jgi:hypothetical protein